MEYSHPQHSLALSMELDAEHRALGMPLQINDYCPSAPCSSVSLHYDFFWCRLYTETIIKQPNSSDGSVELINLLRARYATNKTKCEQIAAFDASYCPDNAIQWYTRDTFLYRELNKAIREQDFDVLFAFRFYIHDIYQQLKTLHEQQASSLSELTVYRGHQMESTELDRLKAGSLISVSSFLSTSKDRHVAILFAGSPGSNGRVGVLFTIEIPSAVSPKSKPYADIHSLSQFVEEKEVLFMLGTVFRVKCRQYDESIRLWNIKLELCSDDDEALKIAELSMKDELGESCSIQSLYRLTQSFNNKIKHFRQQLSEDLEDCKDAKAAAETGASVVNDLWRGVEQPGAEVMKEKQVELVKHWLGGVEQPFGKYMKEMINHSFSVLEPLLPASENPALKSMKDDINKFTDTSIYSTGAQLLENRLKCSKKEEQRKEDAVSDAESMDKVHQDTRQLLIDSGQPIVQSAIYDAIEAAGNYLLSSLQGSLNKNENSLEQRAEDTHNFSTESSSVPIPLDLD